MRHIPLIVATLVIAVVLFFTRAVEPQHVSAAAEPDSGGQTVRQFTPWLSAFVRGKQQVAEQYFRLRPAAQNEMNSTEASAVLNRLSQINAPVLNLVWSKSLGENTGIVMFTVATEDGPIGFKIYYYGFNNQMYISHVQMTRHWSEIERMAFNFDPETGPVASVPLNNGADGN